MSICAFIGICAMFAFALLMCDIVDGRTDSIPFSPYFHASTSNVSLALTLLFTFISGTTSVVLLNIMGRNEEILEENL